MDANRAGRGASAVAYYPRNLWFRTEGSLTSELTELARRLAKTASDAHASDVIVLDIHDLTVVADLFVIASADNERMLRAIARDVAEAAKLAGLDARRTEGSAESGWVLLDFADIVVHVFAKDERQFYRLEEVWSEGQTVLVIQ